MRSTAQSVIASRAVCLLLFVFQSLTVPCAASPVMIWEPGGGEAQAAGQEGNNRFDAGMEGANNPLVEKWRKYYLTPVHTQWLCEVLDGAEQYRLYVRQALKARGMPQFLEYLPVVESNYKRDARSKTGALGLWQFMSNSTKGFLKRDEFVDERLDPWRSTDAALKKLLANYEQFGDWALAIAAYNCGAGALQSALRRNPGKDFWALEKAGALRKETAQYIPRLIAIADICENAAFYGVEIPTARGEDGEDTNPRAGMFDYAEAKGAVSLKRLAGDLKIDEGTLLALNSALFKEVTPQSTYTVRVPEGMGEAAEFALQNSPKLPDAELSRLSKLSSAGRGSTGVRCYKVEAGDSLWKISRSFGVTVAALCEANGIKENATLKIGKELYIPR